MGGGGPGPDGKIVPLVNVRAVSPEYPRYTPMFAERSGNRGPTTLAFLRLLA
jgi:hypothetical protein